METWKGVVIVGMVGAIMAYGYQQNQVLNSTGQPTATPMPEPTPVVRGLIGSAPPAWDIAPGDWVNTPKPILPSDLNGRPTLLEFWRVDCSHCEQAVPFMNGLHAQYKPKGLQIIAFQSPNVKDKASDSLKWPTVQAKAKSWGATYPIAFDKGAELFKKFQCKKWPVFVVIDKDGKVIHADEGHTPEKEKELLAALGKAVEK